MKKAKLGRIVVTGSLFLCLMSGVAFAQSNPGLTIDQNGNVGIGTSTPGAKLDVNGNVNISGTLTATSISGAAGGASGNTTSYVPPVLSNFTWVNQGSATAVQQGNAVYVYAPPTSGNNQHMLLVNAPAPPYTMSMFMTPMFMPMNTAGGGLSLYDSASGKIINLSFAPRDPNNTGDFVPSLTISKMNSVTSWNSSYSCFNGGIFANGMGDYDYWLQIKDDGANRTFSISRDGINYVQLFSVARTDFVTPNEVGVFITNSTPFPASMLIQSFQITTP